MKKKRSLDQFTGLHRLPNTRFEEMVEEGICQLTTFPTDTEKRVENMTPSGAILANFEVFENVVKHRLECSIYLLNGN